MKNKIIITLLMGLFSQFSYSQTYMQYFDGADTLPYSAIFVQIDTDSTNIWQIGVPQKAIFDSAATFPNAIVTDTINNYPVNNISSFTFKLAPDWFGWWGILALQWKQKIDLDKKQDGALIEYSVDSGTTWQNAFNNPYVYNFYGFDLSNQDTLLTGEYAFSGTDTAWKDIWLCFDNSFLALQDSVIFRFTLKSDSVENNKEGWLIDNLMAHMTIIHTANAEKKQKEYLNVYPTLTNGIINIEAEKLQQFHIIESIELVSSEGKIVERFGISPTKFFIDISNHVNGLYFLKIKTNIRTKTFRVFLNKD